jgi:GxxExxY protein
MHTDGHKSDREAAAYAVIGAAYEVSNVLGPGFLEKVYENALTNELRRRGHAVAQQQRLEVIYKGDVVGDYVPDLLVDHCLIVEIKCAKAFAPEHVAQTLNYLKATGHTLALLVNFQKPRVEIKRVVL